VIIKEKQRVYLDSKQLATSGELLKELPVQVGSCLQKDARIIDLSLMCLTRMTHKN
jgi:hypothetical protein